MLALMMRARDKHVFLIILFLVFSWIVGVRNVNPVSAITLAGYADSDTYSWDNSSQPLVSDISGDGLDDLVIFTNDDGFSAYVYLNGNIPTGDITPDTADFNIKYTNLGGVAPWRRPLIAGDINNDGKNDLIIAEASIIGIPSTKIDDYVGLTNQVVNVSTTPTAYLYKIYEAGTTWDSRYGEMVFLEDVDGDGVKDIVTVNDGLYLYYLDSELFASVADGTQLNLATSSNYTVRMFQGNLLDRGAGLKIGDFTRDGKADLVILIADGARGSINIVLGSKLALLTGTGNSLDFRSGSVTDLTRKITGSEAVISFNSASTTSAGIFDITDDGQKDLVVGDGGSRTGDRGDLFVFKSELASTWEGTSAVTVSIDDQTQYSYTIRGAGSGASFSSENRVWAVDLNQNGNNELIIGDYYNSYGCTACGSVYVISDTQLTTFAASVAPDNIFSLTSGANYMVRIKGTDNFQLGTTSGEGPGSILASDFNTDSYKDLIVGTHNKKTFLYLSSRFVALGSSTGNTWAISDTATYDRDFDDLACYGCYLQVGDITGDGANDFVMGAGDIFIFNGGSKINSLNVALTTVVQGGIVDPAVTAQGGTKNIVLKKSGLPISLISTSFATIDGLDWSTVTADIDAVTGKSVTDGIDTAVGASSTHSLYVPKLADMNGVYVCPSATDLTGVTSTCIGGYQLVSGDSGLSTVTIDSADYWKIDGLTGTGAMNVVGVTATSAPSTAQNTSTETSNSSSCVGSVPVGISNLFQVNVTKNSANLYFTPQVDTHNYYVSFSSKPTAEEHGTLATLSTQGVQSFTINHLKPNTTYYLKVRGQNGCVPGAWSNILKITTNSTSVSRQTPFYRNVFTSSKKPVVVSTSVPKLSTSKPVTMDPVVKQTPISTPSPKPASKSCFLWWCW